MSKSIPLNRPFESIDELWAALLEISDQDEEIDPFAPYEELFLQQFQDRFGVDTEGEQWEVLQISRSVDSFLVNVSVALLTNELIIFLRDLLAVTRPDGSVVVAVFAPSILGEGTHVGSLAVFRAELWGTLEVLRSLEDAEQGFTSTDE